VPLWAVIVAAVSGAIIGDSIGYAVGRRWGTGLLHGTVGRLPIIRQHLGRHLDSAQAFVRRRKGSAVFFGRFTAALRVLVPGLAGMSDVHYPSFLVYNVAGGAIWGSAFAVLGYLAGSNYKRAERIAGRVGLVLLALIVVGLIVSRLLRHLSERSERLHAFGDRLAATPPLAWIRRKFPGPVAWARRRLDLTDPRGFRLTITVAVAALAAWAFAGLMQDVVQGDEMALVDPSVESWVIGHRTASLTSIARTVTWLGSSALVIPALVVIGAILLAVRRHRRPAAALIVAAVGAIALYDLVKPLVARPRPPMSVWIGHFHGASFPSGHATLTLAFYGMLAIVLSLGRPPRVWLVATAGAALVTLVVGASRVYLGAHWLSDVLSGYALGAAWTALVAAIGLLMIAPRVESGAATTPADGHVETPPPGVSGRQEPRQPTSSPTQDRPGGAP
jgi:undecaprenyl-diphosphatase